MNTYTYDHLDIHNEVRTSNLPTSPHISTEKFPGVVWKNYSTYTKYVATTHAAEY